jgi:single-stranded-DNA-specific exonuclease
MRAWQDAPDVDLSPLEQLDLQPIIARALVRRGISSPDAARAFLDPHHVAVTSPSELPGMDAAVERITAGLDHHESIWIWGDFDVDGQTATSVLVQTLDSLGAQPGYYVPVRSRESHGVHIESLASVIDRGAQLVVTCDTGMGAHAAVDYAQSRGVDFVITDHHEPASTLPKAIAVVNPRLLAPEHALANLAGVGVAYELAKALLEARGVDPDFLLDLVALGLIADVALLKGETRSLAQRGIEALRSTPRIGLQALAELSKTDLAALTEETIGFELAPRLNAAGRLSDANQAVELLLTQDHMRANVLAAQIEGLNIRRRLLTEQVYRAAEEQLHTDPSLLTRPLLILAHPSWPGGVLGIVASKLVAQYQKPALLLSGTDDGSLRGSARSIEGLDITAAIAASESDLRAFGGHPMAAGVSLSADNLQGFQRHLEKTVERMIAEARIPAQILIIDEWLTLDQLSLDLAGRLASLAPFGAGNPQLVFAARDLHLVSARQIGKDGSHHRIVVADDNANTREVLWWNASADELPSARFDLAYTIRANTFNGEKQLSVEFRELRPVVEAAREVVGSGLEIVDLRLQPASDALPASCLVWAEGADKANGNDRLHLREAEAFAIWTTPPSRADLRSALEITRPRQVYLLGRAPAPEPVDAFLNRLAGMAKYALNQREGKASVAAMAAATAHRELTVRLGLEWLAAGGHLRIEGGEDDIQLLPGNAASDKEIQAELRAGVKSLLEETAAYRDHFARATPETLLDR